MSEETVIVEPVDLGVQDYLQGFLGKCRDRGGSSDGLGVQDYLQGFLGKCRDRGGSSDGLGYRIIFKASWVSVGIEEGPVMDWELVFSSYLASRESFYSSTVLS